MSARSFASRFTSVRHPAFVVALVVLALNDHVLKGSGLLPPVLTGKLSDLAGMIVAPVLVASVFGARDSRRRAATFAVVAAVFAVTELSPAAADLLCRTMTWLGVSWRLVADPTDLVGLLVLPFAWRILDAGHTPAGDGGAATERSSSRWLERALVVASAAACVATGAPAPPAVFVTPAYVVNARRVAVDVRVRPLVVPTRCDLLEGLDVARVFGPDAFGLGTTFHLDPDQVLSLTDLTTTADGEAPRNDGSTQPCSVFAIALGNARETVVWWDANAPAATVEGTIDEEDDLWDDPNHRAARIEITGAGFVMEHEHAPMRRDIEPDACGLSEIVPFADTLPATTVPLFIDAVTSRPEGCLEIAYHREVRRGAETDEGFAFACMPAEAFPFAPGDSITAGSSGSFTRTLSSERARMSVLSGVAQVTLPDRQTLVAGAAADCAGERDACGAYQIQGVVEHFAAGADLATASPLASYVPGASFVSGDTSVFIGRVRAVIARPEACDTSVFALGSGFDAVVVERIAP